MASAARRAAASGNRRSTWASPPAPTARRRTIRATPMRAADTPTTGRTSRSSRRRRPDGGGTRVIGTLNSIASTVFDLDFYSNPSCRTRPRALLQARDLPRHDAGHDGRGRQCLLQRSAFDPDRGGRAGHGHGHGCGRKYVGVLESDPLPRQYRRRRTRGQQLAGPVRPALRARRDDHVGGTPIAGVVEPSTTRRQFVGPSLTPGTVYDIVADEPERAFGHSAQWLCVAFPGRRCVQLSSIA